jgi:hypothetical protein
MRFSNFKQDSTALQALEPVGTDFAAVSAGFLVRVFIGLLIGSAVTRTP